MKGDDGYLRIDGGLRLYYRIRGAGQETVLVPNARMLYAEYEPLLEDNRLVFYDQRGRGASDSAADYAGLWTEYEVQDIERIRRGLELGSINLIGWSYMAAVVALYAQEFLAHVNRVVMLCPIAIRHPAPYDDEEAAAWEQAESKIDAGELSKLREMEDAGLDKTEPEEFCRQHNRVYFPRQMADSKALENMKSDPCVYKNEWPANVARHWRRHFPLESRTRDWRRIANELNRPVLVIHGQADLHPVESSREWVFSLPDARLLSIPNCGHFPHLEAPEVFFEAISSFMAGNWPEGSEIVSDIM
jgi:pimeloyl-ACP methyl ester carboxylesterase